MKQKCLPETKNLVCQQLFSAWLLRGNTGALQNEDGDSSENGGGMMSLLTMDKGEVEMLLIRGVCNLIRMIVIGTIYRGNY